MGISGSIPDATPSHSPNGVPMTQTLAKAKRKKKRNPGSRPQSHTQRKKSRFTHNVDRSAPSLDSFFADDELSTLDEFEQICKRQKSTAKRISGHIPTAPPPKRKKVARRRQIDPTTCERDYSQDEVEFMNALNDYKRSSGRMFPTCSEILEVLRRLGYEKRTEQALIPAE